MPLIPRFPSHVPNQLELAAAIDRADGGCARIGAPWMRLAIAFAGASVVVSLNACSADPPPEREPPPPPPKAEQVLTSAAGSTGPSPGAPVSAVPGDCPGEAVKVFEGGEVAGFVCESDAEERGLTLLDLSDDWVPLMLTEGAEGEGGKQPYRDRYLALAQGKLGKGPGWQYARRDRYFELYGIPPALSSIAARLADDERHACHDDVDDSALVGFAEAVHELNNRAIARARKKLAWQRKALDKQRRRQGLASLDELAARGAKEQRQVEAVQEQLRRQDAVLVAQQRLACEGLLRGRYPRGYYNWLTAYAMGFYQRKHALMADGTLGAETVKAMTVDSRELDFNAALRVLRERVVDAAGIIEDGSAREEYGTVLGRYLDVARYRRKTGHKPLENGAPDLISAFTEEAARQLGWGDPASLAAFFAENSLDSKVAVRLPELPSYYGPDMELKVEINRGDVWYSVPQGFSQKGCTNHWGQQFPVLTLFAVDGERKVPLVRWHTTIGGWNIEQTATGTRELRYKESDVGRRVWRDLVVSPAWFAPQSTPPEDLIRKVKRRYELKSDTLGPSYRSAYGLVMLVHHIEKTLADGEVAYLDRGIRTHGSANYMSILKGCSHGCHRLFNQQAVRLANFLLSHRRFVRHGRIEQRFSRIIRHRGRVFRAKMDNRGYRYELTPPVDVNVLEGRVRGKRKEPFDGAIAIGPTGEEAGADGGDVNEGEGAGTPADGEPAEVVVSIGAKPVVDMPLQLDVPESVPPGGTP